MDLIEQAIIFATEAHEGALRKGTDLPYIIHPLEAASIAARLADDRTVNREAVITAAVLHDVLEDTDTTEEELLERFGPEVLRLVKSNSEDKQKQRPAADSWRERKQETIDRLASAAPDEKIVAFADKLSNLRSLYFDHLRVRDKLWERFNQKDPQEHLWYYEGVLSAFTEYRLNELHAEYQRLLKELRQNVYREAIYRGDTVYCMAQSREILKVKWGGSPFVCDVKELVNGVWVKPRLLYYYDDISFARPLTEEQVRSYMGSSGDRS